MTRTLQHTLVSIDPSFNSPTTHQGYTYDHELSGDDWEAVVGEFKAISGKMPTAPAEQLEMAIMAVFSSWFTPR